MAKVFINGKEEYYEDGTKIISIAQKHQPEFEDDIVLVKYKGSLTELHKQVSGVGEMEFITTMQKDGRRAYRRSVVFLMQRALMDMFPDTVDVRVEFSLGNGYFCTMVGTKPLKQDKLDELKQNMQLLVKEGIQLEKYSMKTKKVREMFREYHMDEKDKLLKFRASSNTNIYNLDGCMDYFYGYMVPNTSYLKVFDLIEYKDGFILEFPYSNSKEVEPPLFADKFFTVQKKAVEYGNIMNIPTVGALNETIAAGRIQDVILSSEAAMEKQIGELANIIASDKKIKFVMMAGPSSSGKTTFSYKLSAHLRTLGCIPHPIGLDDFYLNRDMMPLDEFGEKDFESIEGMDIAFFNECMVKLLNGEKVLLPDFNFKTGKREFNNKYMQLGENDILVIEGIHGLNDRMSASLPAESKYKIYLSALTQLSIDEHNPLSTSDGRLIRRIVRDVRSRGTSAADTIAMWDSVRRGEEKNIFPFQESADYMFNTALIYEMAVLKLYAQPQLYAIEPDHPMYPEAKRLIKLLDNFLCMAPDDIPNNSLVREFIGGSCLNI